MKIFNKAAIIVKLRIQKQQQRTNIAKMFFVRLEGKAFGTHVIAFTEK